MSNKKSSHDPSAENYPAEDFWTDSEEKPSPRKSSAKASGRKKKAKRSAQRAFRSALWDIWAYRLKLIGFDLLMIAVGLVIFAYFHHVRRVPYALDEVITISRYTNTPAPTLESTPEPSNTPEPSDAALPSASAPSSTPSPSPSPSPSPDPNDWGVKFADQFIDSYADITDTSYRSENIAITIERRESLDAKNRPQVYFIADIYIRDIECLSTAFAENTFGKSYNDRVTTIAHDNGAIFAINGDYYGAREKGVVIRNGNVYRSSTFEDVCIIYYDGVMETMSAREFDLNEAIARGAYQAFSFGPELLDENGNVFKEYNHEVFGANPRCAIGYFEPGHYCCIVADGRRDEYSVGLTLRELAQVFADLGCVSAYNLDGGATAMMVFMNKIVNDPYGGGRDVSDIVYIREAAQ